MLENLPRKTSWSELLAPCHCLSQRLPSRSPLPAKYIWSVHGAGMAGLQNSNTRWIGQKVPAKESSFCSSQIGLEQKESGGEKWPKTSECGHVQVVWASPSQKIGCLVFVLLASIHTSTCRHQTEPLFALPTQVNLTDKIGNLSFQKLSALLTSQLPRAIELDQTIHLVLHMSSFLKRTVRRTRRCPISPDPKRATRKKGGERFRPRNDLPRVVLACDSVLRENLGQDNRSTDPA